MSKFIARNYEKSAETIYFKFDVNYNELLARNALKKNFFAKFPRLATVKLSDKIDDEEALLEFLTKTEPETFSMENSLLSQPLLQRIALQFNRLRRLELKNLNLDVMRPEFDFIFEMENLEEIQAYQQISMDFLLKAFQKCRNMMEVRFIIDDLDDASFNLHEVSLFSRVTIEEILNSVESYIRFDSKAEFFYFLRALRKESQLSNKPNDLRGLIFLINDYYHNKMLVDREVRRLQKNEVFYVYS